MTGADISSSPPSPVDPPATLATQAVSLYGRKRVAAACLFLQERTGLDVNVLLTAAWLGAVRRRPLDAEAAAQAAALVADWHAEVVKPLRAVRRRLKTGPRPAPCEKTDSLRAGIQSLEISAELVELSALQQFADQLALVVPASDAADITANNMLRVMESFAGRPANAEEKEAVETLAAETMEHFS